MYVCNYVYVVSAVLAIDRFVSAYDETFEGEWKDVSSTCLLLYLSRHMPLALPVRK